MMVKHELGETELTETPKKVVALDWALTETVLSLGVTPEGVADEDGYRTWVGEPKLPESVVNVGSRREPNLELLAEIKPDVILISKHMSPVYQQLSAIAPTLVYSIYSESKTPMANAVSVTEQLGRVLNQEAQAKAVIEATTARLKQNGDKVLASASGQKPLMFVRFINDKTLRIHSEGSLAQDTMTVMGLKNDWQEPTNLWGFTTAGIEKMAEHQSSNVMIFGPLTADERQKLTASPLWQAMAFTRSDAVYELPAIWTFGGLVSAQRFSDHITQLLIQN
ncbi:iron-siderophore ABC transporter substrate-binding protein [Photobacterium galatheae]|nr:iron-siderophore ABC transporter substrate-binding protein [Photobacterium galatheae]MCM0149583.1 iron-siderophore ABC transporter substrate-binding protein [Photobacterium galatheae]